MKKGFKYGIIGVGIILFLAVLPILYLFIAHCFLTSKVDSARVEYLSDNYVLIDESISDDRWETVLPGNSDSQIYIFGETHGFSKTQQFDLLLFKYLNRHYNVRHYFAEVFGSDAEILTTFLSTSPMDTTCLMTFISNVRNYIPQLYNREYFDKWIALYEYNSTLPEESKIIVHGLLGRAEDAAGSKSDILFNEFLATTDKIREKSADQTESFYCSLGMMHALQDSILVSGTRVVPFAARLKAGGQEVTSILHIPLESDAYLPRGYGFPTSSDQTLSILNADGPIFYYYGVSNFKKASPKPSVALFNLDEGNSPYHVGVDLVGYRSPVKMIFGDMSADKHKATTDYFQYVLLTRGQPAPALFAY